MKSYYKIEIAKKYTMNLKDNQFILLKYKRKINFKLKKMGKQKIIETQ